MNGAGKESGFSLLELVVSVAVMTVVMGTAFLLMTRSQVSFDANQIQAEAHENAAFGLNRVSEIVRGAGSNPSNIATVNALNFLTNPDASSVRVKSDLNGDGDVTDRIEAGGGASSQYFIIASEDVTLRYYPTDTTVNGTLIPGRTICMIDNTPLTGTTGSYDLTPIVIVQNVLDFSCPVGANPREIMLTITAGPSRPMSQSDPRYRSYTTSTRIRLRNR
jgi:prepilin-type N-terminal cleavage/methylation domain-containing protein